MMWQFVMWSLAVLVAIKFTDGLHIERAAYRDVVIEIKDNVPVEECSSILLDLEVSYIFIYLVKIYKTI